MNKAIRELLRAIKQSSRNAWQLSKKVSISQLAARCHADGKSVHGDADETTDPWNNRRIIRCAVERPTSCDIHMHHHKPIGTNSKHFKEESVLSSRDTRIKTQESRLKTQVLGIPENSREFSRIPWNSEFRNFLENSGCPGCQPKKKSESRIPENSRKSFNPGIPGF